MFNIISIGDQLTIKIFESVYGARQRQVTSCLVVRAGLNAPLAMPELDGNAFAFDLR